MRQKFKNPYVTVVLVTGLLCGAAIVFLLTHRPPRMVPAVPSDLPLTTETKTTMNLGGKIIGQFVVRKYSGKPVTVVISPLSPEKHPALAEQAMLTGLKNAVGPACDLRLVALSPTAESAEAPWQPPPVYDEAFKTGADSAVIVCLAGLPERLSGMRFWWMENMPPVIIANAPVIQLEKFVASGKISALLVRRPGSPGGAPLTGERNWLLVTTENVAQITAEHPSIFTKQ